MEEKGNCMRKKSKGKKMGEKGEWRCKENIGDGVSKLKWITQFFL